MNSKKGQGLYQLLIDQIKIGVAQHLKGSSPRKNMIMICKNFFCLFKESSHKHSHPPSIGGPESPQTMADHPSESRSYTDFPVMDVSVH